MVAKPARGQLNRENEYFPGPVRAREFGLVRRVRPFRPASARSFSPLRLNTVYGVCSLHQPIGPQPNLVKYAVANPVVVRGLLDRKVSEEHLHKLPARA